MRLSPPNPTKRTRRGSDACRDTWDDLRFALENNLTYSTLEDDDEQKWIFRCNACGQTQDILHDSVKRETPFPHLPTCPMSKM